MSDKLIDYEVVRSNGIEILRDTLIIHYITKTAELIIRYTDSDGKPVKERKFIYKDRDANPNIPGDIGTTDFTDFMIVTKADNINLKDKLMEELGIV